MNNWGNPGARERPGEGNRGDDDDDAEGSAPAVRAALGDLARMVESHAAAEAAARPGAWGRQRAATRAGLLAVGRGGDADDGGDGPAQRQRQRRRRQQGDHPILDTGACRWLRRMGCESVVLEAAAADALLGGCQSLTCDTPTS